MLSKTLFKSVEYTGIKCANRDRPCYLCVHLGGSATVGLPPFGRIKGGDTELVTKTNKNPGLCCKFEGVPVHHKPEIKTFQGRRHSVLDEEQKAAFPSHPLF